MSSLNGLLYYFSLLSYVPHRSSASMFTITARNSLFEHYHSLLEFSNITIAFFTSRLDLFDQVARSRRSFATSILAFLQTI